MAAVEQLTVSGNGVTDVQSRLMHLIRFMKLDYAIVAYKKYPWSRLKELIRNQTASDSNAKMIREALKRAFPEGSLNSNQQIRSSLLLLSEQHTDLKKEIQRKYPIQFLNSHFSTTPRRHHSDRVHEITSHDPLALNPLKKGDPS